MQFPTLNPPKQGGENVIVASVCSLSVPSHEACSGRKHDAAIPASRQDKQTKDVIGGLVFVLDQS